MRSWTIVLLLFVLLALSYAATATTSDASDFLLNASSLSATNADQVSNEERPQSINQFTGVLHCHDYDPVNVSQCVLCMNRYALDNANNLCVSKTECWNRKMVYLDAISGGDLCLPIDEAACSGNSLFVFLCPSDYTFSHQEKKCITTEECWALQGHYTQTEYPGSAGSMCFDSSTPCSCRKCYCPDNRTISFRATCACVVPDCDVCDPMDNSKCQDCHIGYYITENNKCSTCGVSNCFHCASAKHCLLCHKGYFLDNATGLCKPCKSTCATCTNATSCTTCAGNYVGFECEINCVDTIPGCWKCNEAGTRCERCWFGEVFPDGTCSHEPKDRRNATHTRTNPKNGVLATPYGGRRWSCFVVVALLIFVMYL